MAPAPFDLTTDFKDENVSEYFQNIESETADPASVGKQEDIEMESLPSSQNTVADEEESRSREYFEEDDEKCANCKIVALKMKMMKNKEEQQAKEIKYLKEQRLVEKKLHEEKVKKTKQETIIKTEESTMLRKKNCELENNFVESEKKRRRLEQDLKQNEAIMIEMQRRIEADQREKEKENQSEVRHLKMKMRKMEDEKRKMGGLIKSLSSFYEKDKERSTNSEVNIGVIDNGVLTTKKRKHNEN